MTVTTDQLAARYGRTPQRRRRNILLLVAFGAAVLVVVVAWVVWAGLDEANGSLDAEDAGNSVIDARTVEVSYQISMPAGATAKCALQAQTENHTVIGWKIVDVPRSTGVTRTFHSRVTTTQKPDAGLIYSCWLT